MKQLLLSLFVFAQFGQAFASEGSCDFVKKNSFISVARDVVTSDKKLDPVFEHVSLHLKQKGNELCQNGEDAMKVLDYDSCSSKCVEVGSSDLRVKITIKTKVDALGKNVRECQNVCKVYQLQGYAYLDGVKAGKESTVACTSGISDADRTVNKSDLPLENFKKKTSLQGSKQ